MPGFIAISVFVRAGPIFISIALGGEMVSMEADCHSDIAALHRVCPRSAVEWLPGMRMPVHRCLGIIAYAAPAGSELSQRRKLQALFPHHGIYNRMVMEVSAVYHPKIATAFVEPLGKAGAAQHYGVCPVSAKQFPED
jgi:hypothetical protein